MEESAQSPLNNTPSEPPPSNPPGVTVSATSLAPQAPLTYEETPVIEVTESSEIKDPHPLPSPPPPLPKVANKRSGSCLKTIGIIMLVAVLFAGGIWLSSFVRQFFPTSQSTDTTTTVTASPTPKNTTDPYATWETYDVVSGITKLPISGLQFKLPPEILSPICDGSSCVSQGTYLSGGTRLTIAARGAGQSLRDFRGTLITDANGIPIPTKQLPLGNLIATEYESSTSGRTVSGYAYTQMRGVMIPLTDTLSVEVNHFTPSGIAADFTADDTIFNSIIKTFTYTAATPSSTTTPTILITVSPVPTKTATSSGY